MLVLSAGTAGALGACDAGKQTNEATLGPQIRVISVSVGADRPMPADGAIQFAFDRYLLPSTITRQSLVLVDAAGQPLSGDLAPIVLYDPVARTVTLAPPKQPWLTEGVPYKVVLTLPSGDDDTQGGLRAIDRATLYPGQTLEFAFLVGPKTGVPVDPPVSFCRDVLPIFTAKCSLSSCHGGANTSAESLILTTSAGVAATALNRVSQEANRGPRSGVIADSQRKFGIDMPIIDPGSPGNSWLLYKVDLAAPPGPITRVPDYVCQAAVSEPPASPFTPLATGAQRAADDIERGILSNYVLGVEMPYPAAGANDYETVSLTFEEREKIRIWIQSLPRGSTVPECGGCGDRSSTTAPSDGGADGGADGGDAATP